MSKLLTIENVNEPLANYVRIHRRKVGLSQRELGKLLGYKDEGPVSRHERFHSVPPLLIALGYEIVFQASVSEIFPGLRDTVELVVEEQLAALESELQGRSGRAPGAAAVARKLEWLSERRTSGYQ
jgi:DNA-binding XRE family transcriptional regulator